MPHATTCPDLGQYQRLAAGRLADVEKEAVLEHLEGCDACAARLNALPEQDTLVGLIRQGQTLGDGDSRETIARLVERLSKLRPGAAPTGAEQAKPPAPVPAPASRLVFACPACGKGVKVKGELAGKKVKCPHCKQVVCAAAKSVAAPERAPVSGISAAPASVTPGPGNLTGAGARTRTNAAGKPANTVDYQPAGAEDKELYDFLAPPQAPDELGRLGPYRVLKVLGAGGMGVVFRAEDPQLARLVALKAMLPALAASASARQRFLREARAAAAVKHDHIVTIYQVGEDRGVPFLAMEFLEGEPLDARLKRAAKLPLAEVLRIGREIALGLAAAHQRGLIHRDIKPANVWLETHGKPGASATGGRVKILDFGLARAVGDEGQLTRQGAVVGTPAYMAPEQAQGKSVDQCCDLFSLGCVLYRLATGKAPFRGTDTISILLAVATENPRPPHELEPGLPPGLSELIMGLLAKAPGDRPASAQAVADALEGIAKVGAASRAAPVVPHARLNSPGLQAALRPRKKWPILAGVAACLLLVLAALSAGVFKLKTQDGTIVVENLPADAEVLVDGEKVALKLSGDGQRIEIQVAPGKRKLEIKTADFKGETQEVTLTAGERKPIGIRLEPLDEITDSLGMKLRLIKPGTFLMGSPDSDKDAEDAEKPQHEVTITKGFYLGKYPVTKKQFAQFVAAADYKTEAEADGKGGSVYDGNDWKQDPKTTWRDPGFSQTDDHPVVNVTWNDAVAFCDWASKTTGKTVSLPTEAQYEYANRGGTTTRYFTGDDVNSLQGRANIADAAFKDKCSAFPFAVAWSDGYAFTSPVGAFRPNPFGLYDMTGNVIEWCSDYFDPNYYNKREKKDPENLTKSDARVFRGGAFNDHPRYCRAALRAGFAPANRDYHCGFRVRVRLD